jgi:hypothetical protein
MTEKRSGIVAGLVVLAVACAEMGGMLSLQQQLAREFGSPQVSVNLNNKRYLTVVFQNSPLGELDSLDQAKAARLVAEFVRDHYVAYDSLQMVSVGFATRRGAGPISVTNSRVPYSYRTSDLGPPVRPDSTADSTLQPAVKQP